MNEEAKTILWCPQEPMTEEQEKELVADGDTKIYKLEDVATQLFQAILKCGDDTMHLETVAFRLGSVCDAYDEVVLPIGSPAFMFRFAQIEYARRNGRWRYTFSHSVVDKVDDVKRSDGSDSKVTLFKHLWFFHV